MSVPSFREINVFPFFALLALFLVLLWVFLPGTQDYPYYQDDLGTFEQARQIASRPLAAWDPDYRYGRRFPFYYYFIFLERTLVGFGAPPYFLVLFLLHFANALFVLRLSRVLRGTGPAPLLSALLFLVSTSFYQQLIFIHATQRVLCIFLLFIALFSWIAYLRNRRLFFFLTTLLFQVLSLLTMEDAVIFPFLAALLAWQLVPGGRERNRILFQSCGLLLFVDLLVLLPLLQTFLSSPHVTEKIAGFTPVPRNLLSLLEMFFRPLLVPERELFPSFPIPEDMLRMVPSVFFLLLLSLFFSKVDRLRFFMRGIPSSALSFSLLWIGISVLPFLFQPLSFEHANRYLYLPMVGFSQVFGLLMARLFETVSFYLSKKGLVLLFLSLGYIVGINLWGTSYQYKRYIDYGIQHRGPRYYDRVRSTFKEPDLSLPFATNQNSPKAQKRH